MVVWVIKNEKTNRLEHFCPICEKYHAIDEGDVIVFKEETIDEKNTKLRMIHYHRKCYFKAKEEGKL